MDILVNIEIDQIIPFLYAIAIFSLFLVAVKLAINSLVEKRGHYQHCLYEVKLPKEKPGDTQKEFTKEMMREEIYRSEMVLASIGGLRAQRGFKAWLLGRNDHFSFEIVANRKKISFFIVAPLQMGQYLEQQVHAYYPEAVIEVVPDYNIFHAQSTVVAGYMKTRRHFIFPIKTYDKMEADPLNSVINVMSKLDEREGLAIQYTVRSARAGWHLRSAEIPRLVRQGKTVREAIAQGVSSQFWSGLLDLVQAAKPKGPEEARKKPYDQYPRNTAMEEEMLKGIEEKNAKAGLDVNIRVIVSSADKGRAHLYLQNIASAFSQYNYYEYGNSFRNKVSYKRQNKLIHDFIYRRYDPGITFLLNTQELASLFHFPLKITETPNIAWLTARHAPAPSQIPSEGIIIGRNIYRAVATEIRIKRPDRRRHMYIIGKSGVGKSQFMAGLAIQDILNGEGVCVIDPHGDLIDDIIDRIPPERAEDVILFAPADTVRPLALNLLEFDPRYPEQKTFVINEMIKIFDKLYDLRQTGGPIFEQYMRNAMLLVMSHPESGSTLMEIPKVLADAEFRRMKLSHCGDPTVVDFWRQEAEKAGGDAALANVVPYITSKLTSFISNDMMRPIIGQQKSSFNLRDIMDSRKLLLIDLSKGQVGEMNAFLLGMIIVGKILMSALSRTNIEQAQRKDFYLYIDEFQNFTTDSICSILSEARKYNLNLIMAHQYLGQLVKGQDTSIKDAVFGNVGSWIVFKVGSEDAQILEKEFSPVFNQYDLINIEKYTAYVKLLIDNTAARPFSMASLWPLPGRIADGIALKIKTLSRLKYGQDRSLIEAEIRQRIKRFS
ncbi:MAG: type IV secretion system DNA-binding domain-containing protein [Planctomycetes bacterium]|nr:type IV secretion system DNA-binding domain-containing protein [Planctomycetota bacterium]